MTGKAPGAPCKRCRAGSIPAFSTGSEGDGNPLALGARRTRFDSEVPDHGSLAQTGKSVRLKPGRSLVRFQRDSRGCGRMAQALAFQASYAGSIPAIRSARCKHDG
jgi:hypothetical protein